MTRSGRSPCSRRPNRCKEKKRGQDLGDPRPADAMNLLSMRSSPRRRNAKQRNLGQLSQPRHLSTIPPSFEHSSQRVFRAAEMTKEKFILRAFSDAQMSILGRAPNRARCATDLSRGSIPPEPTWLSIALVPVLRRSLCSPAVRISPSSVVGTRFKRIEVLACARDRSPDRTSRR